MKFFCKVDLLSENLFLEEIAYASTAIEATFANGHTVWMLGNVLQPVPAFFRMQQDIFRMDPGRECRISRRLQKTEIADAAGMAGMMKMKIKKKHIVPTKIRACDRFQKKAAGN